MQQRFEGWNILFDVCFLVALQLCTSLCLAGKPPALPTIQKDCVNYKNKSIHKKYYFSTEVELMG